jgi:hypothetical protein
MQQQQQQPSELAGFSHASFDLELPIISEG